MHPPATFSKLFRFILYFFTLAMTIDNISANIDCSYCKSYTASADDASGRNGNSGEPFLFMGDTYSKRLYLTNIQIATDYFNAAYSLCARYGLQLATIRTSCEYCILQNWFFTNFPTSYSTWIAGFRFGNYQTPFWITTGEPLNFAEFGLNDKCLNGPYPSGHYDPIAYPWVNCLSVSRNCPDFPSDPAQPCTQNATSPDLQFTWKDCRFKSLRVICEETSYSKIAAEK